MESAAADHAGGQRHYSDLAIETALTLRAVFRMALRQTEGLIGSIMRMLEVDLPIPDHSASEARRDDAEPSGMRAACANQGASCIGRTALDRRQHRLEIARRGGMVV